jgi:hypothetical protein
MNALTIPEQINQPRRRFFGAAAATVAVAQLGLSEAAMAQPAAAPPVTPSSAKPGSHASFSSLKYIEAGVLNVGYAEDGPADGPAVVLLHGWPYDIHS